MCVCVLVCAWCEEMGLSLKGRGGGSRLQRQSLSTSCTPRRLKRCAPPDLLARARTRCAQRRDITERAHISPCITYYIAVGDGVVWGWLVGGWKFAACDKRSKVRVCVCVCGKTSALFIAKNCALYILNLYTMRRICRVQLLCMNSNESRQKRVTHTTHTCAI